MCYRTVPHSAPLDTALLLPASLTRSHWRKRLPLKDLSRGGLMPVCVEDLLRLRSLAPRLTEQWVPAFTHI